MCITAKASLSLPHKKPIQQLTKSEPRLSRRKATEMGKISSRREFLSNTASAAIAGLAPSVVVRPARAADTVLYVNTWGGSWTAAETEAYFKPFTKETGIEIR